MGSVGEGVHGVVGYATDASGAHESLDATERLDDCGR